jgi:hypothetical protein
VMSYYEIPPADRKRFGICDNMIRLACGIENAVDLIADLKQALEKGTASALKGRTSNVERRTTNVEA